jgi:putative DNA primase/helicase
VEGILAWVIEGSVEWYRNGLTDPPVITNAAKTYQSTSDELAGFVDFVIVADDDAKTPGTAVYNAYIDWAHEEGVRPWSRTALFSALCERIRGASKIKRREGIWLYGLRLSTDADRGGDE